MTGSAGKTSGVSRRRAKYGFCHRRDVPSVGHFDAAAETGHADRGFQIAFGRLAVAAAERHFYLVERFLNAETGRMSVKEGDIAGAAVKGGESARPAGIVPAVDAAVRFEVGLIGGFREHYVGGRAPVAPDRNRPGRFHGERQGVAVALVGVRLAVDREERGTHRQLAGGVPRIAGEAGITGIVQALHPAVLISQPCIGSQQQAVVFIGVSDQGHPHLFLLVQAGDVTAALAGIVQGGQQH